MLLHDGAISTALAAKRIGIEPLDLNLIQPSSIDLRLGSYFALVDTRDGLVMDPKQDNSERVLKHEVLDGQCLYLQPHHFILASTAEVVTLPLDIAARVEGKSSLGRLGLLVHSTAGFVDPGFSGEITLELANLLDVPIRLYPGMLIAQMCFFQMTGYANSYATKGKYQGQRGPVPSKYHLNFDTVTASN